MAILNKGQTFSDGEQVTSAKLNTAVDGATFASGAVDDVSTQLSGGAIIVKDGGVGTAKIADSNVTTAKIADSNITTAKIADDAVTPAKLSEGAPTWDGDGNVGVGTSSPNAKLEVREQTANDDLLLKVSSFRPNIVLEDLSSNATDFQLHVDSNNFTIRTGDASTNSKLPDERMRINSNGHITGLFVSAYPVGSIYMNASNSTNPSTLLGFGTWVSFGAGRVLVGIDSSQSDFDTAEETGGSRRTTLTTSQIPSHTHSVDPPNTTTSSNGSHVHTMAGGQSGGWSGNQGGDAQESGGATTESNSHTTNSAGNHTHTINIPSFTSGSSGSGASHNNLQPYIVVYMWKRTA